MIHDHDGMCLHLETLFRNLYLVDGLFQETAAENFRSLVFSQVCPIWAPDENRKLLSYLVFRIREDSL